MGDARWVVCRVTPTHWQDECPKDGCRECYEWCTWIAQEVEDEDE
jgi:hypothetical protein